MRKSETRYYCDECKEEVKQEELKKVNYSLNSEEYGHIGSIEFEVCDKCFNYYSQLFRILGEKIKSR